MRFSHTHIGWYVLLALVIACFVGLVYAQKPKPKTDLQPAWQTTVEQIQEDHVQAQADLTEITALEKQITAKVASYNKAQLDAAAHDVIMCNTYNLKYVRGTGSALGFTTSVPEGTDCASLQNVSPLVVGGSPAL